jgi:hypothetical protein
MFLPRIPVKAVLGLAAVVLLSPAPAAAQDFKGQIQVGIHKVKVQAGKVYSVELTSNCSDRAFPIVECFPTRLTILFADKIRNDQLFLIPTKTGEETLFIVSPLGPFDEAVVDYTLTVQQLPGEFEKPVMQEKVTITDKDPVYQPRNSRHKPYNIKLKAGNMYVIDLVKTNQQQDPYLYLEDANMKIVRQDDDSGGDLNARIIFQPPQDGDFRIIATTLNNTLGDMNLTVRMLPAKKK